LTKNILDPMKLII